MTFLCCLLTVSSASVMATEQHGVESAPNLADELRSPDKGVHVDVRSYERKDGVKITEYAVHGRVFKIKVEPGNGMPAYYLYDRDGHGHFDRLPGGSKPISPPTWILKRF